MNSLKEDKIMTRKESTVSRRAFLSNAAIIGASSSLGAGTLLASCAGNENKLTPLRPAGEIYIPDLPDKAIDGKPIKAALIGCGARGTGAAINFMDAGNDLSIVACADVLDYRIESCRNILKERKNIEIADDMCFSGFDAYKKVCELRDVDVVLIATPSGFHPEQLKYAIDHEKHVFCEKAACVDPVGYRTFMMGVKQAQSKGLCIVMGAHRHHHRGYVESYRKIQEGYIGRITSANLYHNGVAVTPVRRMPEWTDMEYMLRGIFHWKWLTGDMIVDNLVHYVDAFTWFSHLKPLSAISFGSRLRTTCGDVYDNFSVDFEYEGGINVHAMLRQIDNCHVKCAEKIQGTKGSWKSNVMTGEFAIFDLDGNVVWKYDAEAAKKQFNLHDPYTLEHINLVNHIRNGKVINRGEITATASLACIMARESAYTGNMFTWDEMAQSNLNLMPSDLTLGNMDMSKFTVPLPGTPTSFQC